MLGERTPTSVQESDEASAFLQTRIALFWKVLCVIMLFATVLGVVGAFKHPGADIAVDLGLAALAGALYGLMRRGVRSARFSRTVEAVGLLLFFTGGSLLGR